MNKYFSFLKLKENSDIREILLHGASTFGFKIISLLLAYLLMLLIANKFGADAFGRYSITITLSQLLVMVFTLGLPVAIVKLTSNSNNFNITFQSNYLAKALLITIISSILISLILFSFSEILSIRVFDDIHLKGYFNLLSFFLVPLMFHESFSNFFRGKKDFTKYNLFTFILPYVFFFPIFYFLISYSFQEEITFLSYVLGITVIFILELVAYFKLGIKSKTNFSTSKLLKLSFPMMFSTALLFLLNWTDIFMLGSMKTSTEVGIYNVAFKIASLGYIIIIAINVVIAPKISELYNEKKMSALKKVIHQSTRLIIILTIPIMIILFFLRKQILGFFGEEFLLGETALIIIGLGVFFSSISGNVDQILNMTNSHKTLRNITIFCFVTNVILNYLLIPLYGINGAATASLITNILVNVICLYYIKKNLGFLTFI
jgi:O-antigen/teichoic acid export membrane protein